MMKKLLLLFCAMLTGFALQASAHAETVATVARVGGMLSVIKADGTSRILGQQSPVEAGDVLTTENDSFAMLKFTDGGLVTLRPNTRLKVDEYTFTQDKPESDSFVFSLVKGGLRTITGLVGHRGNRNAYRLNTATATIGIRGTNYEAHFCQGDCGAKLQDGLYLYVHQGAINAANDGGSVDYGAGVSGFVKDFDSLPTVLPQRPVLPTVLPPDSSSSGGGQNKGISETGEVSNCS